MFNESGVSDLVNIHINQISAFSSDSVEIAMTVSGNCNYQIIAHEQSQKVQPKVTAQWIPVVSISMDSSEGELPKEKLTVYDQYWGHRGLY